MNLLSTLPRQDHYVPAFSYVGGNIPLMNHKKRVKNFKADIDSDYFSILLDSLSIAKDLVKEIEFESQININRVKVLKMRLKTSLHELIGAGIKTPYPGDKNIISHLELAISTYRLLSVRSTTKLKEEYFNELMAVRNLLLHIKLVHYNQEFKSLIA